MDSRFFVPASTFIVAVLGWVAFLVWRGWGGAGRPMPPGLAAGLCAVVGGLVVYSGFSCLRAGGPRVGLLIRAGVLLVLAAITLWKVGRAPAIVLTFAAIATGLLALSRAE